MSSSQGGSIHPYRQLGVTLKRWRLRKHATLVEVSGAVEIDTDMLEKMERGETRPTEEILLLLISYFNVTEDEASGVWQLAGYEDYHVTVEEASVPNTGGKQQTAFVLPMDIRVVYTDVVHVTANDFGVVMNFLQTGGPSNQPLAVARVGMSHEHAMSIVTLLQQTLDQSQKRSTPRQLPPA